MKKPNNTSHMNNKILFTCIFLLYLIIGIGYLGEKYFVFDLISHFYFIYTIIAFVIVCVSILSIKKRAIIASLTLLIFLIFHISKAELFVQEYKGETDIFYINSNFFLQNDDAILSEITKLQAKYIMIAEIHDDLHEKLTAQYSFSLHHSQKALSLWIYSNEQISFSKIHELTYPILEIQADNFSAILIHPLPPLSKETYLLQKQHFDEARQLFDGIKSERKIIIWDFNSTFYSQVFQKYFWDLHYKPIYSRWYHSFLRIPIDYAIWNKKFFEVYSTNFFESDHLPLLIDIRE